MCHSAVAPHGLAFVAMPPFLLRPAVVSSADLQACFRHSVFHTCPVALTAFPCFRHCQACLAHAAAGLLLSSSSLNIFLCVPRCWAFPSFLLVFQGLLRCLVLSDTAMPSTASPIEVGMPHIFLTWGRNPPSRSVDRG